MTPMASAYTLEFEKPLLELERQIEDLKRIGSEQQIDIDGELEGLQGKLESLRAEIYRNLTPIQRVMVARPGVGGREQPAHVHRKACVGLADALELGNGFGCGGH